LLAVVLIVVCCLVWYPGKLEAAFHVPAGVDGITATEWILFRIFMRVSVLIVVKDKVGI
jgi:hypothetical protein